MSSNSKQIYTSFHSGDKELNDFFNQWNAKYHNEIIKELKSHLYVSIVSFNKYLSNFSFLNSINNYKGEIYQSLYKIFANVIGNYIALNTDKEINVSIKEI
jgi:hypothetical protein